MPTEVITLDGLVRELDGLPLLDRKTAQRATFAAAQLARNEVIKQMTDRPHPVVNTGELRRRYTVTALPDGARLENTAPYAAAQEYGTRPFWAPIEPLIDWARKKIGTRGPRPEAQRPSQRLGPPAARRPSLGLKYETHVKALRGKREAWALSLARSVQHAIARRGIVPKRFHAEASVHFPEFMRRALVAELKRRR